MGEVLLLKKLIADKVGCSIGKLEQNNVTVLSAGIAAMSGGSAANQAVEVMKEHDLDITEHRSQPFTDHLANHADLILTMTEGHRQAIIANWPQAAVRTSVIRRDGLDVSDPIGMPVGVYRSTAQQISENLAEWVSELDLTDNSE